MIHLYDTHLKRRVPFRPMGSRVGMYACGPTVHDAPHLGNARSAVAFDVLRRVLAHVHGDVLHVRNITDVDDKIIAKAALQGISIDEVTTKATGLWHDAMRLLHVLPPHVEPKATEHVDDMIAMISRLLWSGHAYRSSGHVLFVAGMGAGAGFLTGQLSGSGRLAGARVADDGLGTKRNPADFVLWKPAADDEPGWPSPWGRGRPGWHIECSAMSARYLGESFDIHAGGADLMTPHHENEMSQSCAAHATSGMASYWVHNGMLTVGGKKMSKSLGNFVTVQQAVDGSPRRAMALRLLMLGTHYRGSLDYSQPALDAARQSLDRMQSRLRGVQAGPMDGDAQAMLLDDLNVPGAMSRIHQLLGMQDRQSLESAASFLELVGLDVHVEDGDNTHHEDADKEQMELIEARTRARALKDWRESDRLRDILRSRYGIVLEDGPSGTTWKRQAA